LKITAWSFLLLVYQLQSFFISSFHPNLSFFLNLDLILLIIFLDLLLNWFSFQFHLSNENLCLFFYFNFDSCFFDCFLVFLFN
jgi:hypothetical protein